MILRFREECKAYIFVLDGASASLFPFVSEIWRQFGHDSFSPEDIRKASGLGRATVWRHITVPTGAFSTNQYVAVTAFPERQCRREKECP
jgi:hypothetical protein